MSFINEIKTAYRQANVVEKIIYIQVLLFVITLIARNFIENWFALNASFDIFITRPWTLISYGFLHGSFIHLIFNLIFLYYIGNLFFNFFTAKQFLNYFILGTVVGGTAFLILHPIGGSLVGASAGVMAVLVGIATKIPTYEIRLNLIGGVKLWIIAAIYILISVVGLNGLNSGGNIAHLGGALLGFIYTKQLERGLDIGRFFEKIIAFFTSLFQTQKQSPLKTVYKKKNNIKRKDTYKEEKSKQNQINFILDKISKSGYESLSKEEKEFLFKAGK